MCRWGRVPTNQFSIGELMRLHTYIEEELIIKNNNNNRKGSGGHHQKKNTLGRQPLTSSPTSSKFPHTHTHTHMMDCGSSSFYNYLLACLLACSTLRMIYDLSYLLQGRRGVLCFPDVDVEYLLKIAYGLAARCALCAVRNM